MTTSTPIWATTEPTAVSETGVSWWLLPDLTKYATDPDPRGIALEDVVVYGLKDRTGEYWYMVAERSGKSLHATKSMHDVWVYIDKLKTFEQYEHKYRKSGKRRKG